MDLSPGWADYNVFLVGQALGRASKATGPSSRSSGIAAARRRRKPSCGEVGKLVRDLEMQQASKSAIETVRAQLKSG